MFTPPTYHLGNFLKAIKMPTCTHTGRFMSVPLCSGQSELASICLFVQVRVLSTGGGGGAGGKLPPKRFPEKKFKAISNKDLS